jgi:hypothetical protein
MHVCAHTYIRHGYAIPTRYVHFQSESDVEMRVTGVYDMT